MSARQPSGTCGRTKEAKIIAKAVKAAGGNVELTSKGHLKITGPGGTAIVASKPGSYGHGMSTTLRTIRNKAGLDVTL
jgi:hypothetical protein